jgi:hypothetical protein
MTQWQKQQVQHFGLAMATPDVSHTSTFRGCRLSSNQNHSGIDIGNCVEENTTSPRSVVNSGDSIGIWHVNGENNATRFIWLCC